MLRRLFVSSAEPSAAIGPRSSRLVGRFDLSAAAARSRIGIGLTLGRSRGPAPEVIPLLAISGGAVVGSFCEDAGLQPPPARPSAPFEAVELLLAAHTFRRICLVDLDALEGKPIQMYTVASLETRFPQVEFWNENGAHTAIAVENWLDQRRGRLVIGSDTQQDASLLHRFVGNDRIVLSLDHRGAAGAGPAEIFETPSLWPTQVIVRTLSGAGSGAGAGLARLCAIKAMAGARFVYAAGGVRGAGDPAIFQQAGIAGALVAPRPAPGFGLVDFARA